MPSRLLDLAHRIRAEMEADIEAVLDAKSSAPEDAERLIELRQKLSELDALIATLDKQSGRQA